MYRATTSGITVTVLPVYIDEQSDPSRGRYFWAYRVVIENHSGGSFQLVSRYWRITDGNGHVEEVRGEGVVGEQPLIPDGGEHAYTSGCPLTTPSGIMEGSYFGAGPHGEQMEIEIPAFPLDLPDLEPSLN